MINKIIQGNCFTELKKLEAQSVNCCVTSPPYWGLRDYGEDDQLGMEKTPEEYVEKLVDVFREVKRVLKDDGTLWLNLGDSYNGSGGQGTKPNILSDSINQQQGGKPIKCDNLKPKDLVGIPWMVAFALRSDGWYLRQDIIWHKPNPMPEPVKDRCTKSHEYIFLLSKSKKYYYNQGAIKTPLIDGRMEKTIIMGKKGKEYSFNRDDPNFRNGHEQWGREWKPTGNYAADGTLIGGGMANKKSVWMVATKPFKEAHFATFPPELIVDCIKAGCPEDGTILDPFAGAFTTPLVARKLNRGFIAIELNASYIKIGQKRLCKELGMFI